MQQLLLLGCSGELVQDPTFLFLVEKTVNNEFKSAKSVFCQHLGLYYYINGLKAKHEF